MNEPTIFTRIINGEIPCYKVYEDEKTIAFLDIHPVAEGHTLVVSKAEVPYVWDLSPEDHRAVYDTVQKVGRRLREVVGTPYVGEMVVGTDVPHAHVHVVPFTETSELKRTLETATAETDHEALATLAERLRFE
jgi:histidine triad (HIT) family protein